MKKIILILIGCIVPQISFGFFITEFHSDLRVKKNGSIFVTETIKVNFSATPRRHGIIRKIPFETSTKQGGKNYTPITNMSANRNHSVREEESHTIIKIGDPNRYVSENETYKIYYEIDGVVKNFPNESFDQIYWNVTGNQWDTKILKATARITLPTKSVLNRTKCFTGIYESTDTHCSAKIQNGIAQFTSDEALSINEGLTIVYGFDKDISTPKNLTKPIFTNLLKSLANILKLIPFIIGPFLFGMSIRYQKKADKENQTKKIIPKYLPIKNGSFSLFGRVVDGNFEYKDLGADLIQMAINGYIKIEDQGNDGIKITKLKEYHASKKNIKKIIWKEIFKKNKDESESTNWYAIYLKILKKLEYNKKFQEKRNNLTELQKSMRFFSFLFGIINPICGIIALFTHPKNINARLTAEGLKLKHELLCLKEYIETAESQQLNWASKQDIFEKLLPYAIIFNLEKKWSEKFKNHIKNSFIKNTNLDIEKFSAFKTLLRQYQFGDGGSGGGGFSYSSSGSSGFSSGGGFSGGGSGGGGGSSW